MGSDEMIHFQEEKMDELLEGFILKYKEEWAAYCDERFQDAIEEWEANR